MDQGFCTLEVTYFPYRRVLVFLVSRTRFCDANTTPEKAEGVERIVVSRTGCLACVVTSTSNVMVIRTFRRVFRGPSLESLADAGEEDVPKGRRDHPDLAWCREKTVKTSTISHLPLPYLTPAASIGHSSKRLTFSRLPSQCKEDSPGNIIHKPLTPLRLTLELCAMFPFKYNRQKGSYYLDTCSIKFFYSGLMALWLAVLAVFNTIGIFRVANPPENYEKYIHTNRETQLLGVAIISSCVANAFVEILNVVMVKEGFLELLNGWNHLSKVTGLRTTQGLRKAVMIYVSLLWAFSGTMFIMTLLGKPDIVNDIITAFADVFLQVNEVWMLHPDSNWLATAAIRALVCTMILQVYIMYKATMFAFVSSCKIIRNALREWRRRLRTAVGDLWKKPEQDGDSDRQLFNLVRDHHQIVVMVRKVELIFSPSLQCYYGSTLVALCVQMYLLAYRMAQGEEYTADEAIWHSVLILQTVLMFFLVSLSASGIPEEVDASADVLRRGLPFDAPDRAKYHFNQLLSAVTSGPPVAISGGKFFIISRPFIITVVGAVVSYFVIILQLNLPSASRGGGGGTSSCLSARASQVFNETSVSNGTITEDQTLFA